MSAFVCNKSHINAMILAALHTRYGMSWYHNGEYRKLTNDNADEVGQMLLDENVKSVMYRYEDSEITNLPGSIDAEWLVPFKHHLVYRIPNAIEAIKATRCYVYQSCEHPEWEESEAKSFCGALIAQKIGDLPGYEEADGWEWDDPNYGKLNLVSLV